jgi:hypothetical protein
MKMGGFTMKLGSFALKLRFLIENGGFCYENGWFSGILWIWGRICVFIDSIWRFNVILQIFFLVIIAILYHFSV